ncbi:MAG: XdhC/CoxI family protein [Candidatus Sedimenticola sp. 6PFRAG1]
MTDIDTALHPIEAARDWLAEGLRVALATVIETWGSSPRPVGSHFVVNEKAAFSGSVSAGCIESFLVSEMLDVIDENRPHLLTYGVSDTQAQEARLSCGGTIQVYVEPVSDRRMLETLCGKRPVARVLNLADGRWALSDNSGTLELTDALRTILKQGISMGQSRRFTADDQDIMLTAYPLPRRLIIIGAVHIAQFLVPMAALAGFEATVIEPRPAFARSERFIGFPVDSRPVANAMADLAADMNTAVVTLAHDPLLDDPALITALGSDAYYIGCLGSRSSHAQRLDRLRAQGFDQQELSRLHGPVGLDLGGRAPAEIAVSILAEIVAVRHDKQLSRETTV